MSDKEDKGMTPPRGYSGAGHADRRGQFARLKGDPRDDRAAERAFLVSKIELINCDLQLTDEEKTIAVAALQSRLDALAEDET